MAVGETIQITSEGVRFLNKVGFINDPVILCKKIYFKSQYISFVITNGSRALIKINDVTLFCTLFH